MRSIEKVQSECDTCPFPEDAKDDMCPICLTQQAIRGKWKLLIIWLLKDESKRFSELQKAIPNVKQGPLTMQLKELVSSGLVHRKSYNQVPPKVVYSLTEKGKEFLSVMSTMEEWANKNLFL